MRDSGTGEAVARAFFVEASDFDRVALRVQRGVFNLDPGIDRDDGVDGGGINGRREG